MEEVETLFYKKVEGVTMERRFSLREIYKERADWRDWGGAIKESELKRRQDAIINLRVQDGGINWSWDKAIGILLHGTEIEKPSLEEIRQMYETIVPDKKQPTHKEKE